VQPLLLLRRTIATPAPNVATSRLAVPFEKPLSCSHTVKNTRACREL
jgi:hypothetical protein